MFQFDFKILFRSLKKRWFNSLINLVGLSAGITCILLIAVYLNHELSFDQHQTKKDRTYRIALKVKTNSGSDLHTADTFIALAHTLKNDFPEVEQAVRIFPYNGDVAVKYKSGDNKNYKGNHIFRTEQEIFSVFDHQFLYGNPSLALSMPHSIVVTESLARRYFGSVSPLNKALLLDDKTYRVTGVIKDLPKESDLYYEALISFDFAEGFSFSNGNSDWGNPAAHTYVVLKDKSSIEDFQSKLNRVVKSKTDNFIMSNYDLTSEIHLYPQVLSEIHFEKPILSDTAKGNRVYINILIIVGLIIFLIAVFNYGNYTASYYTERIREINVRKYFGASKKNILKTIVSEMLVVSLFILVIALLLFTYFIPFVNELTNNALGLSSLLNSRIILLISVIIFVTTTISILYPITFLVGNNTQHRIQGANSPKGSSAFRRSLLGVQFLCTTLLVFFSLTVYYQIQFLEDKNLGFDTSQVLVIDIPEALIGDIKTTVFKNKLGQKSLIKQVSVVSKNSDPGSLNSNYQLGWVFQNDEKIEANFNFFEADKDFASLLDIEFLEGTDFIQSTTKNKSNKQVIVNEAFTSSIGLKYSEKALGQSIHAFDETYEIVGVVKNFHFAGIQKRIEPLVIANNSHFGYDAKRILIKLNDVKGLAIVETQFLELNPNAIFDYKFIDEQFSQLFYQERTVGKMTNLF